MFQTATIVATNPPTTHEISSRLFLFRINFHSFRMFEKSAASNNFQMPTLTKHFLQYT